MDCSAIHYQPDEVDSPAANDHPNQVGDFQNPEMPLHFAAYAAAVAERYPWVRAYTPVNEIYVSARNTGWDGLWNERLRSERGFVTALKHLVAAS